MELTQERLKFLVYYDPATGIFTKLHDSSWSKAGFTYRKPNAAGYIVIRVDGTLYLAHRLAFLYMKGFFPDSLVDHINCNRSDNRYANLRQASFSENSQNRSIYTAKSKVIGTYWHKKVKKWAAQIRINGKNTHLGYFDSASLAGDAYLAEKKKHHHFFNPSLSKFPDTSS